jgi:hypothetical protein
VALFGLLKKRVSQDVCRSTCCKRRAAIWTSYRRHPYIAALYANKEKKTQQGPLWRANDDCSLNITRMKLLAHQR